MEPRDTGISLVLVTRNRESDLARTLETLKGALCPCPWEIILVDNASDTDMSRVCKASGLENLRFFRTEENLGLPAAGTSAHPRPGTNIWYFWMTTPIL